MKGWLPVWILWSLLLLGLGVSIVKSEGGDGSEGGVTGGDAINGTKKLNYNLTGIPQIDYIYDPNLPRELNGYNLSTYPFFNRVPKNINFSCDGLKDGFYASIKHGCQLYHHCLFGTRFDFLCANYTAFDQRTFICQFVSEVDCPNSALFFHRNDALYQAVSTTTPAPVIIYVGANGRRIRPALLQGREDTSSSQKKVQTDEARRDEKIKDFPPVERERDRGFRRRNRRRCGPGRRRRCRRPRPRPDYYDYYDDDYYESDRPNGKKRNRDYDYEDYEHDNDDEKNGEERKNTLKQEDNEFESRLGTSTRSPMSKMKAVPMAPPPVEAAVEGPIDPAAIAANREKIFSKSRAPPKIRPPVPLHEKTKYNGIQRRVEVQQKVTTTQPPSSSTPSPMEYEDYYDDELEQHFTTTGSGNRYLPTVPPTTTKPTTMFTTTTTTTQFPSTEPQQYEYDYEDYEIDTTTSTTQKPTTPTLPGRHFGPRRLHQRQESQIDETQATSRVPGIEHQKINEALEAPSKATLRIPYHSKPRPPFLKNSQMLMPVTTVRSTSTTGFVRTTTPERPTSYSPHDAFDGEYMQFPESDANTRVPLETVSVTEGQRFYRNKQKLSSMTTTPETTFSEEYVGFEEADAEEISRYGQKQHEPSSYVMNTRHEYIHPPQQLTYSMQRQELTPPIPTYQTYMYQERSTPMSQQRLTTRSSNPNYQQQPNVGHTSPYTSSSLNTQTQTSMIPRRRAEYVSLMSEDDQPASNIPQRQRQSQTRHPSHHSRFSQSLNSRPLLSAAQEVYPVYTPTQLPSLLMDEYMNSNSKSLRQPNVFQTYPHQQSVPFSYPAYRG